LGAVVVLAILPMVFVVHEVRILHGAIEGMAAIDAHTDRIVVGKLRGERRETPSGVEAVAWAAWLDVDDAGDDEGSSRHCEITQLDGLSIETAKGTVALTLVAGGSDVLLRESKRLAAQRGSVTVAMSWTEMAQPNLGGYPECSHSGTPEYFEAHVGDGARVAASGCMRAGKLHPCGDGLDFFLAVCASPGGDVPCRDAEHAAASARVLWAAGAMNAISATGIFGGATLFALGLYAAYHRRRGMKIGGRSGVRT
jgi:hypothetical protein